MTGREVGGAPGRQGSVADDRGATARGTVALLGSREQAGPLRLPGHGRDSRTPCLVRV